MPDRQTGEDARTTLSAAMLGMQFTNEQGNHDVKLISERIVENLREMNWALVMERFDSPRAGIERAIARHEEKRKSVLSFSSERELVARIEGMKQALAYLPKET